MRKINENHPKYGKPKFLLIPMLDNSHWTLVRVDLLDGYIYWHMPYPSGMATTPRMVQCLMEDLIAIKNISWSTPHFPHYSVPELDSDFDTGVTLCVNLIVFLLETRRDFFLRKQLSYLLDYDSTPKFLTQAKHCIAYVIKRRAQEDHIYSALPFRSEATRSKK